MGIQPYVCPQLDLTIMGIRTGVWHQVFILDGYIVGCRYLLTIGLERDVPVDLDSGRGCAIHSDAGTTPGSVKRIGHRQGITVNHHVAGQPGPVRCRFSTVQAHHKNMCLAGVEVPDGPPSAHRDSDCNVADAERTVRADVDMAGHVVRILAVGVDSVTTDGHVAGRKVRGDGVRFDGTARTLDNQGLVVDEVKIHDLGLDAGWVLVDKRVLAEIALGHGLGRFRNHDAKKGENRDPDQDDKPLRVLSKLYQRFHVFITFEHLFLLVPSVGLTKINDGDDGRNEADHQ